MSASLAPFGFRPAYHPSGTLRARAYKLVDATQAAYGTALYKGAPVVMATTGVLNVAAAGADWLGVLEGFEYIDSAGKPTKAPFLPASPTGITEVWAYVYDDPDVVYEVQAGGTAVANTAIGDQLTTFHATFTTSSGVPATGQSTCAFTGVLAGAGVQGMAKVLGIGLYADNAWGDTNIVLQVQNARPQLSAVKVAI